MIDSANGARPTTAPLPTDPAELERHIADRRADLAASIDELTDRLQPKALARHAVSTVQEKARAAATAPDGSLRVERLAAVGAAVVAVLAVMVIRRRRRSRR